MIFSQNRLFWGYYHDSLSYGSPKGDKMLVELRVKNFRSIKDEQVFSLVASNDRLLQENTIYINNFNLLKTAAIYGANGSGKSNLVSALNFMKHMVVSAFRRHNLINETIPVEVFALNSKTENEPAMFEITFISEDKRFRYGFEVNTYGVVSEWLFHVPKKQEIQLFLREKHNYTIHPSLKKEAKGLTDKTREDTLFLSVLSQFNSKTIHPVIAYFKKLIIIQGDIGHFLVSLSKTINQGRNAEIITAILKKLNFQIENIRCETREIDFDEVPPEIRHMIEKHEGDLTACNYITTHNKYDEHGKLIGRVDFDLELHESDGTKQFMCLIGPFMDVLSNGGVLVIDEIENSLHTLLVEFLIGLFKLDKQAQLIFTTHNTKLLSNKLFRRDQIWFTEKDSHGATTLTSLYDFSVRKDASYEKDYLAGKYGAVPYLEDISGNFYGD